MPCYGIYFLSPLVMRMGERVNESNMISDWEECFHPSSHSSALYTIRIYWEGDPVKL